jgi:hypothetical protein
MLRVGGVALAPLAARFGLSKDTLNRHMRNHVTDAMRSEYLLGPLAMRELVERANLEGMALLDYLHIVRSKLLSLFTGAAEAKDAYRASVISGRLLECLREIGKITGEIVQHAHGGVSIVNNVAVTGSPEFARLQSTIIAALAPFPEARQAVIAALRSVEPETANDRHEVPQPILITSRKGRDHAEDIEHAPV